MNSRSLICALIFLGFSLAAWSQVDASRDGNWWNTLSAESKNIYVVGVFDGMGVGRNFALWGTLEKYGNADPAIGKIIASYNGLETKYLTHVTSLQLSDGLTEFYKDYRNRSIPVSDAVWPVIREIAGDQQGKIDSLVRNLRKNAQSSQ